MRPALLLARLLDYYSVYEGRFAFSGLATVLLVYAAVREGAFFELA